MWNPRVHLPSRLRVLSGTPPHVHPLRGSTFLLAHRPISGSDTIYNSSNPPLANIILLRLSLKVFKTRLLERGFHTLIKSVSFSSPIDMGSHNPPFDVLADTRSFLQSIWDPHQIHPLQCPASLLAHYLVSTPFESQPPH